MIRGITDACSQVAGWNWTAIAAFIGVVVGLAGTHVLTLMREERVRRRVRKGQFAAIAAEVDYSSEVCKGFLNDKILAPLYRLPLYTYEKSLPAILADGVLSQDDVMALLRFYGNTDSFNRGLELVQKARDAKDTNTLRDEVQRLVVKAEKALSCGPDNTSFYNRVAEMLEHRKDLKYKRLPPETFPKDDWPVQIGLRQWWMSKLTASHPAPSQP